MTTSMTTPITTSSADLITDRISSLRGRLRGAAVIPVDELYDEARFAWNLNADHRPAVVVLAEDAAG
jgi:hypothetical protein